jgi:hypothetical protein
VYFQLCGKISDFFHAKNMTFDRDELPIFKIGLHATASKQNKVIVSPFVIFYLCSA